MTNSNENYLGPGREELPEVVTFEVKVISKRRELSRKIFTLFPMTKEGEEAMIALRFLERT